MKIDTFRLNEDENKQGNLIYRRIRATCEIDNTYYEELCMELILNLIRQYPTLNWEFMPTKYRNLLVEKEE